MRIRTLRRTSPGTTAGDYMKKRIFWTLTVFVMMISVISMFSLPVFARTKVRVSGGSNPFVFVILPIFFVAVFLLKSFLHKREGKGDLNSAIKKHKKLLDQHPEEYDSGLTLAENEFVHNFQKELEDSKPKIIGAHCPNCGAPLMIGDKVECEYCHSQIMNANASSKNRNGRQIIPPGEYNPIRYYEENRTGYKINKQGFKDDPYIKNAGGDNKVQTRSPFFTSEDIVYTPENGHGSSHGGDYGGGYNSVNNGNTYGSSYGSDNSGNAYGGGYNSADSGNAFDDGSFSGIDSENTSDDRFGTGSGFA